MKKLFTLVSLFTIFSVYSQDTITKALGDFTALKVYNGIDVELIKSDKQEIVITGEKAKKVNVKNTRNILKLYLPFPEALANGKVKIIVYYSKNIAIIDANEGASITAKEFKQQKVEIKTQEMAFINMVVETQYLSVKAVTGGVIKLTGSTKNQNIEVNNSGVYHGYNLQVENTTYIRAALGGKGEVNSGETLDAKVSFGGTIFYKGTPQVLKNKKVLGGTIEAKN